MPLIDDIAQMVPTVDSQLGGSWYTGGVLTNPAANALEADTGELTAGYYDVTFFLWNGSANIEGYNFEHRNAANTANLHLQVVSIPGNDYLSTPLLKNFGVAENERFRILNRTAIVGVTQGSIIFTRRA
ncbi:hypothetical protein ES703_64057 [subsurface metagenome]